MTPEEIVARLIYRDGLMLVIDKPAGLAVHKGPKGGESLEDYFGALRFGLPRPPALAHRLDRDTSGCLVLGRHRKALATLEPAQRQALELSYFSGLSHGEIAMQLGKPLGTVKSYIRLGLIHLREKLRTKSGSPGGAK